MTQRKTPPRPSLAAGLAAGALLSAALVQWQAVPRVVDGDTIDWGWRIAIERQRYRLAGIDAPETRGAKCSEERERGKRASARLGELLAAGKPSVRLSGARDKYARGVASLLLDGHDVGETLMDEGHAHPYTGRGKRGGWCLE